MPKPAINPTATDTTDTPWKMPQPHRGQTVIFHRLGLKNEVTDVLAIVLAVSPVNVEMSINGIVYESIRHCDDPRAKGRPELRDPGTWDFSDHEKELWDRIAKLEEQMAELLK